MSEPFESRLEIDRVDRDIFTGRCHAGAPLRAFGGHVAAQALVAAGTTVEDPESRLDSLHAYFLRPGRTSDPIVYLVDRLRDGRSFTTRRVRAQQYGETIFAMSASFARAEDGLEHEAPMPDLPGPDACPASPMEWLEAATEDDGGTLLDVREVPADQVRETTHGQFVTGIWVRTAHPLPDSPLVHECALTYVSDLRLAGAAVAIHGGRAALPRLALASLDHALWFHRDFRADEWLLYLQGSPVSGGGRALNLGRVYDHRGHLVVSAAQEALMRVMRDRG